ncbi:MAG TPA: biopolymer transporter ExbD [Myxococcota bacterium]|nr:biopolymer transporter ExbD [Myxococcota bacterium]
MGVSLPGGGGGGRGKNQNFDLNLVPFIDLLSVNITFLLVTAVWLQLSSVNVEQSIQDPNAPPPPPTDTPPTPPLTVHISADAVEVFRNIENRKVVLAQGPDKYDWVAVEEAVKGEKEAFPGEIQATIITDDGIHYEHMIKALDVTRAHGFEKSLLGGGPARNAATPPPSGG